MSQWKISALLGCAGIALIIAINLNAKASSEGQSQSARSENIITTNLSSLDRTVFETLLRSRNPVEVVAAFSQIEADWSAGYIPILLELIPYSASYETEELALALLKEKTGQNFERDVNAWYEWWWNQPAEQTADYADLKAQLYRLIDPRFEAYFKGRQDTAQIRLDEVRWGGVVQDGIPPLRGPDMISANDGRAQYLQDDNIVFGIEINGDARAYPKRILAWHEMFVDTVGGVDIAGVYCTLCGTVIPYKTQFEGTNHALGTSGSVSYTHLTLPTICSV